MQNEDRLEISNKKKRRKIWSMILGDRACTYTTNYYYFNHSSLHLIGFIMQTSEQKKKPKEKLKSKNFI